MGLQRATKSLMEEFQGKVTSDIPCPLGFQKHRNNIAHSTAGTLPNHIPLAAPTSSYQALKKRFLSGAHFPIPGKLAQLGIKNTPNSRW